jgi:serine/threonine protein kinase/Tfp pilus assembly protein PilF
MNEREVFANALQKSTDAERSSYLDEVCAGDSQKRDRILELLLAERQLGSFIESPPAVLALTQDMPEIADKCGTMIGPYKLLQQIGEGGFGLVYMAEQREPVRRKVALKVIKPGMDSKEVIARFDAERQALALMEHRHIAKVLDCGTTPTGVAYFVMELVHGIPITDYCDQNKLPTRERLELFVSVCQAIQHAHHKGIIHRDIKPANVMVSRDAGGAVPRIIDFGISKAIDRHLTEKTLFTECGRMIGTPMYMSPEQAGMCGLDVDTRTDIYSLGVLLYELLTGATPVAKGQLEDIPYDEIRRIIRDEDPLKPSTKINALGATATTVSADRQTDPKKLSALLRHDLDWIVMKALEKDRDRRYETANSFAADIQRYLKNEPVDAYPPSATYRFSKFARRNQRTLLTAAAVVAMLVAGTVVSVWQAIRAKDAERIAKAEAARATVAERIAKAEAATSEAVIAFLNRDLLAQADPSREPNRDLKVREALDRASAKIDGRFQEQPLVEAAIRHAIGTSYLTLGEYSKAEQHLLRAVEIRRRELGPEHRKTIASLTHLAITTCDLGRHLEAENRHKEVLQIQRGLLGAEDPQTLGSMMNLAASIYEQGRYEEVEQLTLELLRIQRRVLGAEHPSTLKSMMNLASVKRLLGQYAEAEQVCRELLPIQRRVLRAAHPDLLNSQSILANAVLAQSRHAEAEQLHQEVYDLRRQVLGPEHPATLSSLNNLSLAIFNQGRYEEAEQLRVKLLEVQRRVLGGEHPATLATLMNLANLMNARGDSAAAEKLHREVLETRRRVLGAEHPRTLVSRLQLVNSISAQGRHVEAEQSYRDVLASYASRFGSEHPDTLKARMNLSVSIHQQGRFAEAEELRREILNTQIRVLGPEHADTLAGMLNLANSIYAQGRHVEAETRYREVLQKMRNVLGEDNPSTLKCMMALANVVNKRGRYQEAEECFRRVLEIQRRVLGAEHPDTLYVMNALAWFLAFSAPPEQRNPAEAVELARETLAHQPDNGNYRQTLAQAQYRAGALNEAIKTLQKSIEVRGPSHHDVLTLALVHWHLDQKDQAMKLYEIVHDRVLNSKCHIRLRSEVETLMGSKIAKVQTGIAEE